MNNKIKTKINSFVCYVVIFLAASGGLNYYFDSFKLDSHHIIYVSIMLILAVWFAMYGD